jgi:acyl-CoA dehydrogenase
MDFSISPAMQTILAMIDEFVVRELIPLEKDFLADNLDTVYAAIAEKRALVHQMELWAPLHPAELGGMGLSLTESALIFEALGRSPLGLYAFGCHAPDAGNIEILHEFATPAQSERFLAPLVKGEIRSCFSMTEVDMPGSNPIMLETSAVKDGDDYVINGHKWYTTAADGAAFAIVMAVTDPDAPPHRRASMIIVPTNTPGFHLVRNIPVMGHAGKGYFSHGEILYQNCRVPQSYRLGEEGAGFAIAQNRLGPGRIHHCMRWIGICNRVFDLMCARALERTIAPGRKLADKEIIQGWIAQSAAEIQAARLMVLNAAWKIEQVGAKAARKEISLIKFVVANTLQRVIDRALQIHGGLGMTDDTLIAFFYRHERAARIYDGADEVHKLSVARQILRHYANKTVH